MAPVRKLTRAEQARQYLAGGAVLREDSDDELGLEDHPWEWLYEDNDETQTTQDATPRKRKAVAAAPSRRNIRPRSVITTRPESFPFKASSVIRCAER